MTPLTVRAPAQAGVATKTVVRAVRAWQLPPQPAGLPSDLPEPVAAAAGEPPAGPAWAEHRTRFAIELVGDGVSGWHAPVAETVAQIIADDLAAGLIGHDAAAPRRLAYRKKTGRHRNGAHARQAASAVELACWDLASRATGLSVTGLLGGTVRPKVPAYASALGLDPSHASAPEAAAWITAAGFWGQKWPLPKPLILAGPRAVAQTLGRLREAAGEGRFMIDALGRCRLDEAMQLLPVLADLQVTFAEELLPPGSFGWHRLRAAGTGVPLAAGEHAVDELEQTRLLTGEAVDVWQVDPGWSGGLARSLHTTELAADLGMATFPHGDRLPAALALAGACCRDKIPAIEWHLTLEPLRQQIYLTPVHVEEGMLPVRTVPGLAEAPTLPEKAAVLEVTGS
ncbi:L-alanine-DL-glutamate epimerase-like enolase superfamily enzyme [Streptomyces puniciscabiei]|uniref:L-alanine-DL-glutamate epimerase-like enolase superfamily enzyme n=1 Tax=Streptomyces puniciscabiei TaxID=164348 RepID=A0A542UJ18_9ACTN|nr:enolase C-terminal domain-like protein [Streptomyces puniciscabiei]TQK99064.1 L-alanine-DL-glutamate epimerase-like enolase superfamily enzyme [Streptomyces puniciscabiei]